MKVGIIGTGNIGGTIARKLKGAGHDVRVANSRGLEGVRAFANEIGASAVDTRGAVEGVDLNGAQVGDLYMSLIHTC
jgi:predicted dinucleotide-binding enzyme